MNSGLANVPPQVRTALPFSHAPASHPPATFIPPPPLAGYPPPGPALHPFGPPSGAPSSGLNPAAPCYLHPTNHTNGQCRVQNPAMRDTASKAYPAAYPKARR